MKSHFIQYTLLAIACGMTSLMFSVILQNRRQKMKKIRQNKLPIVPSKLEDSAEYISLNRKRNYLTISQLPAPRWVKVGKVTNLYAYPLVSGKPCVVDECQVKYEGMYMFKNGQLINWDRAFVVYNIESKCIITSNNFPTLHEVDLMIENNYIILQAAQMPTLSIKLRDNEIVECTYWCCEKIQPFPKIVCTDCGDDVAQWLSRFLWGKDSGLRLGHAINAVGCMGIYWQLVLRNCILYQRVRRNKHSLKPFIDILHSILISPTSYNNTYEMLRLFEPDEMICPNVVILISNLYTAEKWEWIKIGGIIIKNTQPFVELRKSSMDNKLLGLGVNCELYLLGRVKLGDNVYLHIPDNDLMEDQSPRKKMSSEIWKF
ncbi:mitochondrial amidoxime-reducing component 1-like isoform X2 [Odontomachus brunneus]|uniref:mitochondrial amidoxime-reducing component 1-like isoform X2 n=1 Tax=Odontomachus brunneus TaxID=486640 RepID=UPI0013F1D927|nr:mitochondrial amidoxime-reducing component 1-like isoform X2 [Odontomachus brunneus]